MGTSLPLDSLNLSAIYHSQVQIQKRFPSLTELRLGLGSGFGLGLGVGVRVSFRVRSGLR